MKVRRLLAIAIAGLAVVAAAVVSCAVVPGAAPGGPGALPALGVKVPAGAPLPMLQDIDPEDLDPARDIPGLPPVALAPPGGAVVQTNGVRIPKPAMPTGPRRIGIQVGHWMTDQVPAELGTRITFQTGTSWAGVQEVDVTMTSRSASKRSSPRAAMSSISSRRPCRSVTSRTCSSRCTPMAMGRARRAVSR